MAKTFEAVAGVLRVQYLIGFCTKKVEGGKVYQIKVRTDAADALVGAKSVFRERSKPLPVRISRV